MINRISPFIIEIALGLLIGIIMGYYFNLESIYEWLKNNDGKILSIYAILNTVSAGFTVLILSENDKGFVKFLIEENADKWYRSASIFNLGFFILGTVSTLLISTFVQNNIALWIVLFIIGINIVQVYSTLVLILNYTDLKRKFQEVR